MSPVIISSLAIIAFSAMVHASLQLSVSVLTLMSGHSIGKKSSQTRLLKLMNGFLSGALAITILITTSGVYYLTFLINRSNSSEQLVATVLGYLMIALSIAIFLFYYRPRSIGTKLWIPRGMASYLSERATAARSTAEAFSLGMTSIVAEIMLVLAPTLAASLAIVTLPDANWQIIGILLYSLLSILPLVVVSVLVGNGYSTAKIQKWREKNKRFLQFMASGGLLILACFILADRAAGLVSYGGFW